MSAAKQAIYVLDTSALIGAFMMYYRPALCPGFGAVLHKLHVQRRIFSIGRVKEELLPKQDAASEWALGMPSSFFARADWGKLDSEYLEMSDILRNQGQHTEQAIRAFTRRADGWLVAYAMATGAVLITHEGLSKHKKGNIRIPVACKLVDVQHSNLFNMLEDLHVRFDCHAENT